MKILVVDDDEIALMVAEKALMSAGHEVLLAEDGESALNILKDEMVQTVITDWNMPRMDGIDLVKKIRDQSVFGYTYIIMVTSRSSSEDKLGGLVAGVDDYITKPFDPNELQARVRIAERILALETTKITVEILAKLTEAKDDNTGDHIYRMQQYSRVLANYLVHDPELRDHVPLNFSELMFETSITHDIGKLGIRDSVLLKQGSLNEKEWEEMKAHTTIGAEAFDNALKLFPAVEKIRIARDIAWAHHERWDGTGYPRRLAGEDIPLCARIVTVADVYDAVTMKRVYKSAMPHEVARGIIVEGRGKHFDPKVVDAFLACEQLFLDIKVKYPE
jgi:putative two-component system response regulator